MKILIVNMSDINGGAARASYRLHKALLNENINSQMLVQSKESDDFTVIGENSKIEKGINKVRPTIDALFIKSYKNRSKTLFSPGKFQFNNIANKINDLNPDIVHLHWINGGMLTVNDIGKIKAPIVWSLHDMWAFTGGCHYDEECKGYEKECGNCKALGSNNANDLSKKIFKQKEKIFSKLKDLTIVGLSNWLNECSKKSTLLKDKKHINLPNPIDTNIFKLLNKRNARELWNLPQDKRLVLFGAVGATSDPRKGFKELSEAMKKLKSEEIEFVIFGSSKPKEIQNFGFKTYYLGHLHDDISLITLYSAVDVMIVPSLQENLSNAIMESLACGTPVVSLDVGGNSDMIDHKKNGYLAKPYDVDDLADGIEWILNTSNYSKLCENAREKVTKNFDSKFIAKQYIKLYQETLDGNK
jgi:glycosyltransferase involved in cell wall biosynthesis